jgi:hypothetical protein
VVRNWVTNNAHELNVSTDEALRQVYRMVADEVMVAYYRRDFRHVARDREALRRLWPTGVAQHPLFRIRLMPRWVFRAKDLYDRLHQP